MKIKALTGAIMLVICFIALCTGVYCASFIGVKISGDLSIIPVDLSNSASITLRANTMVNLTMSINNIQKEKYNSTTYAKMKFDEESVAGTATIDINISIKNISPSPVGAFFAGESTTIASGNYATDGDIVVCDTITESGEVLAKIFCTSYTPIASDETAIMKLKIYLIEADFASIFEKIKYSLLVEEYVPTENYVSGTGLVKLPYNDITTITSSTFSNKDLITYVALPNTVTKIESGTSYGGVFYQAEKLKGINISNIQSLGNYAFSSCLSLQSVTLPDNLTSLPTGIFSYCTALEHLDIPKSIGVIEMYACYDASLFELDLSNCTNLTVIYDYAFTSCDALSVNLSGCVNLTQIYYNAFSSCVNLKSVDFTGCNNLTIISDGAFLGCSSLESITIVSSVTQFGMDSFGSCSSLKTVIIDSQTIANRYAGAVPKPDGLLDYADYIYIKSGLSVGSYLSNTSRFSSTTITSGIYNGYVLYTRL